MDECQQWRKQMPDSATTESFKKTRIIITSLVPNTQLQLFTILTVADGPLKDYMQQNFEVYLALFLIEPGKLYKHYEISRVEQKK